VTNTPARGDITGRQMAAHADERVKRDTARQNTINALASEPVTVVSVPGGRNFLIPREAFSQIVAMTEEAQAR
jgi:predicted polyphosphate/ATP-dependent NAD kinase